MTVRARIDAGTSRKLDIDDGTSRHISAREGSAVTVHGSRRDGRTVQLRLFAQDDCIAEVELIAETGQDYALLGLIKPDGRHPDDADVLAILIEAAFQRRPEASRLLFRNLAGAPAVTGLATETVTDPISGESHAVVHRHRFYQLPLLWRPSAGHIHYPAIRSALGPQDRLPPLRPPQPRGEMYRRWLPHLGMSLSLRPIDRRRDLALFHDWMNQPRVAFFWELAKSEAELDTYLAAQETDPHIFGVVGSFDDEPVGYFEFYWCKEDRLGPYYDAEDFDRGWHGLIGNARHLGRPKTLAWFRSLTHYLFLDEPRTRRIMGEPRASHQKMLSYCADAAYDKIKEFDFPHKRAALVCCERERFFREVPL